MGSYGKATIIGLVAGVLAATFAKQAEARAIEERATVVGHDDGGDHTRAVDRPDRTDSRIPVLLFQQPLPPQLVLLAPALDAVLAGRYPCVTARIPAERTPWAFGWLHGSGREPRLEAGPFTPFGHYLRSPLLAGSCPRGCTPAPARARLTEKVRKHHAIRSKPPGPRIRPHRAPGSCSCAR